MKQVRSYAFVLICLLILPLALSSCAGNGERLYGRWETRAVDEELGTFSMVYHFTEDGEIFIEQKQGDTIPFSIPFGTWSARGDRVTIRSDGEEKTFTFSVDKDELTLSGEGEDSLVFHRI